MPTPAEVAREAWTDPLSTAALDALVDSTAHDDLLGTLAARARHYPPVSSDFVPLVLHAAHTRDDSSAVAMVAWWVGWRPNYGVPVYPPEVLDFLASFLADASARRQATRALWAAARCGNDLERHHAALRELLRDPDPHVVFFAAMALASASPADRRALLDAARDAEARADAPPDIGVRDRYASYVSTFSAHHDGPTEESPEPDGNGPRAVCAVCAGTRLVEVHHDGYADNSGRWETWTRRCADCGKHTTWVHDD
ncbi:MAG: HEAT repeat domain-containing protein [Sandaracinaceae bacterium]|nr:HEAT repeat domain-containing protein [Sandaracinaceae bacterium]